MTEGQLAEILQGCTNLSTQSLHLLTDAGGEAIYSLIVDGTAAMHAWLVLRNVVGQTRYWPILLGDEESVQQHINAIKAYQDPPVAVPLDPATQAKLAQLGLTPWLERQQARIAQYDAVLATLPQNPTTALIQIGLQIDVEAWLQEEWVDQFAYDPDYTEESLHDDWPSDMPAYQTFTIPYKPSDGRPLPAVYLALLPTTIGWQAPAFLRFGGWNACPRPGEHVAILKRWYDLYGAEVAGISRDVIELYLPEPIRDRSTALMLAQEQFVYANDIVDQGVGSLEALAASLLGSTVWSFWWD